RRTADDAVECAHEVREVLEAYLVSDLGDGAMGIEQKSRRQAKASPYQVLMGCCSGHTPEDAQEVKGTEPNGVGDLGERKGLLTRRFDAIHRIVDAVEVTWMPSHLDDRRRAQVHEHGLDHQVGKLVNVGLMAMLSELHQRRDAW